MLTGGATYNPIAHDADKVLTSDRRIKVHQLRPTIKLTANVRGTHARSLAIKLRTKPASKTH